jgi:hypothetical protein
MSETKHTARREYLSLKVLQIAALGLIITIAIVLINRLSTPGFTLMAYVTPPYFPMFEILLSIFSGIAIAVFWRWYHLPSLLQHPLKTYFESIGYSTQQTLFHTITIRKDPDFYFKLKLQLYRRISGEPYIIKLESMPLQLTSQKQKDFTEIGEKFLLQSDLETQRYRTSCELEELHLRSRLMLRALEEFFNLPNS